MREVVNAFKDKGDANGVKSVQSTGLHVAGEKFIVLKADERSLYGKKVRTTTCLTTCMEIALLTQDYTQGREGIVIVKTTQALLVTHYPETVQPGAAANTVEQLADYLIGVGY